MDDFRSLTEKSISECLLSIKNNYMKIYDHYYSNKRTKDDAFFKDLVDCIDYLNAILSVYTENYKIHPAYAIEKLTVIKSYIDISIRYFEQKERKVEYE